MSDFRGAALMIGCGAERSGARHRGLKLALFLTDADGAAYSPEHVVLADGRKAQQAAAMERLSSRGSGWDTLWIHVCGAAAADPSLPSSLLCGPEARHTMVVLEDVPGEDREAVADSWLAVVRPSREGGAVLSSSPPRAWSPGAGESLPGLSRPPAMFAASDFSQWLLDWMSGRQACLGDRVMFQALREALSLSPLRDRVAVRTSGDAERIQLGRTFPWLGWTRRTTMPGHVISSLTRLVELHGAYLLHQLGERALSAELLSGFVDSLFASLWRESQRGEAPAHMEKLARDRRIIEQTLLREGRNRTAAAQALGISRSTLYQKIRRLGISTSSLEQQELATR